MEKPTKPLAETRLLLAPAKERALLAPAKKPPKPQLPQETVGIIRKLAMEGKSPKKIRALTGIGTPEIRRHLQDIEFGSANVGQEDPRKFGIDDFRAQPEEALPRKAVAGPGFAGRDGTPTAEKPYIPFEKRKKVPRRFLEEARLLLGHKEGMGFPTGGVLGPAEPRTRRGRPMLPESELATGKRYVPPAKREIVEHEQIMAEHDLPTLKKVYFDLMDWKSPERVSEETKIPLKRIVQIIFNRKTQRAVFANYNKDIQKKYAMPNEELGIPKEPDIIAQNKALLYVVAARKIISENPKYWGKNERRRPWA